MKRIFHKNQVIITALAFLIAIAGYISYDRSNLGKDNSTKEASAGAQEENYQVDDSVYDIYSEVEDTESTETLSTEQSGTEESSEQLNPGETVLTSNLINSVDYAAEVKLNREQVRSKNKDTLMDIVNSESVTDEQKQDAVNAMIKMTDVAEKEADAEMMLEAKGFTNVVVSVSEDQCDVVLDMGDATDAKRAQVEDIVKRKTGIEAQNIIITAITTEDN